MQVESLKYKSFFYPPGGILIWMIVFVEMITFMMGMGAFVVQRNQNLTIFQESQKLLNPLFGIFNTLFLVTAGYFMALAVSHLKRGDSKASIQKIRVAILFGISFLGLKGYEYFDKINHGVGLDYSDFFMYYWMLTGFHFIHVLAGIIILLALIVYIKKGQYNETNNEDVETGAIFWHMCDLIWMILFPILYLL